MKKRINCAKGLAVLLLVITGICNSFLAEENAVCSGIFAASAAALFLICGYEIGPGETDGSYINRLFRKTVVPYLFAGTVVVIINCISNIVFEHNAYFTAFTYTIADGISRCFNAAGWSSIFNGLQVDYPVTVIWILPALFFGILIFRLAVKLIRNDYVSGAVLATLSFAGYITSKIWIAPCAVQAAMIFAPLIWAGYIVGKSGILSRLKWQYYLAALCLAAVSVYLGYSRFGMSMAGYKDLILVIILGVSGALIIYLITAALSRMKLDGISKQYFIPVLCIYGIIDNSLAGRIKNIICGRFGSGKKGFLVFFIILILLVIAAVLCTELIVKFYGPVHSRLAENSVNKENPKRDSAVAAARGIFTILMLVGHYKIDITMNYLIYSCHMAAFVLFSGYFYKRDRSFSKTVIRMCKTFLLPYLFYVCGVFVLNWHSISWEYAGRVLVQHICGISFTDKLLPDIESVGPVYFILMLFVIRILYMLVDRIAKSELAKNIVVLLLSLTGVLFAELGWWLPWSIDVALYCLAFYRIGYLLRKYRIMEMIRRNHIFIFALGAVWAFEISGGGMELAWRNYGSYLVVILGASAGTLVVYKLAAFITENLPVIKFALKWIGEWSVYVIIIHTLTRSIADNLASQVFNENMVPYYVVTMSMQIAAALLVKYIIETVKKSIRRKARSV